MLGKFFSGNQNVMRRITQHNNTVMKNQVNRELSNIGIYLF